jgi:hypothetical protein
MDYSIIHFIIGIISFLSIILLYKTLQKIPKNNFIITMIILSIALMVNVFLYSAVFYIDNLDNVSINVVFYNWWSLFIRVQNTITIFWISILAYRRLKK